MNKHERAKIRFLLLTTIAIIKTLISLIPVGLLGLLLIPHAIKERGYIAFGGEWVLIIALFCITYIILTKWFDIWSKSSLKRSKSNEKMSKVSQKTKRHRNTNGRLRQSMFQKNFWNSISFSKETKMRSSSRIKKRNSRRRNPTIV